MATNATEEVEEETLDTSAEALRTAKEEAQTATEEPKPSEEELTKEEESPKDESNLTIETPEPEKDLEWYKKAYGESTKEALRLSGELKKVQPASPPPTPQPTGTDTPDPDKLYIEHLRDKDINIVWTKVVNEYPELGDPNGEPYKKFVQRANIMGKTILTDEKRYVEPSELYPMVISSLGFKSVDSQEKLGAALRDGASSPKVSSGGAPAPQTSKVTDKMIALNRKMYPGKTDAEIREELEPHVQ